MPMSFGSYASRVVATKVVATDGTGDYTDIQSAIDDLPSGGGVVYVKEGTYTITSKIYITIDNVSIIGAGKSTIIQTSSNITMIHVDNAGGCTLRNLYFIGAGTGNTSNIGIHLESSVWSFIDHCWVETTGSNSIKLENVSNTNIISCYFTVNYDGSAILLDSCGGIFINNNIIYVSFESGIETTNTCYQLFVTGNLLLANLQHGIFFTDTTDSVIEGNVCEANDFNNTTSYDGIHLAGDSDNNIISGNRCKDNDNYEINISAATCNKNIVTSNQCVGTDHQGAINDSGTDTESGHNIIA